VNDTNGAGSLVGNPSPTGGLTGLGITSGGTMYATTIPGGGGTSDLITLNSATGALIADIGSVRVGSITGPAISIGDLAIQPGTNAIFGLRSNADGTSNGGEVYTINAATGIATFVGDTTTPAGGGLAFAPDGSLWQSGYNPSSALALNKLNPTNAAVISSVTLSQYYDGLAIRADGKFYAVPGGSSDGVYTLNASTGAATLIGNTGAGGLSDLAFAPTVVAVPLPIPGVAGLALLGGVFVKRRGVRAEG
jgi:hypothetical protein